MALKPCFMMSPMSVAQYLRPGQFEFDLLVMDEASQIKPEDSIGAMARASQIVVVGDPKQLPPTSFFDKSIDVEEEESLAIEVSQSILDATIPLLPLRRLRWHYRSKHEDLIAFSNHAFYQGDLVLFPSPHNQSKEYGVLFTKVDRGRFLNGRNLEEAKAVAQAVATHFENNSGESLGVVAMNSEQREQIACAIEDLAKSDDRFRRLLEKNEAED